MSSTELQYFPDSVRTQNCWRVRRRNAWLTSWPLWVYNQYDDLLLVQRVVNELMNNTMIKPAAVKVSQNKTHLLGYIGGVV